MIDHTGVNVSNFKISKEFYIKALAPLGYTMMMEFATEPGAENNAAGFGEAPVMDFWLGKGTPNKPHIHVAFRAKTREQVDAFYAAAMAAGAKDNGKPGPRPHYHTNYYGAFVLDPDGHNIEAVCHV